MWLRRVQACHFHLLLLVLMQKRVIVIKRMNELFILISKPHKSVICLSVRRGFIRPCVVRVHGLIVQLKFALWLRRV